MCWHATRSSCKVSVRRYSASFVSSTAEQHVNTLSLQGYRDVGIQQVTALVTLLTVDTGAQVQADVVQRLASTAAEVCA